MLAHQALEDIVARQKTEPFAEARATPESRELSLIGQPPRVELVDA